MLLRWKLSTELVIDFAIALLAADTAPDRNTLPSGRAGWTLADVHSGAGPF
jgi:hypothetical protein